MWLNIKTMNGNILSFQFKPFDLVMDLKKKIEEKTNISSNILLIFNNQNMSDSKTLSDYKIVNNSTIIMKIDDSLELEKISNNNPSLHQEIQFYKQKSVSYEKRILEIMLYIKEKDIYSDDKFNCKPKFSNNETFYQCLHCSFEDSNFKFFQTHLQRCIPYLQKRIEFLDMVKQKVQNIGLEEN